MEMVSLFHLSTGHMGGFLVIRDLPGKRQEHTSHSFAKHDPGSV